MDVHPVVGPVDALRIPSDSLEVFVREHRGSFANISCLEDETVVEHEREKLIQSDFLCADLPSRVAKALEIRIDLLCAEQRLPQGQGSVDDVQPAVEARAAGL